MPVVVELLLVDEEREAGAPEVHLPLARGVFSDLERQLQDATSHLRRKSIFGNLVSRGAAVVHVADEQLPLAKLAASTPVVQVAVEAQHEIVTAPTETTGVIEANLLDTESIIPTNDALGNESTLQVPPINRFPKSPTSRRTSATIESWWPVIFDWWPSTCTPTPCKALTGMATGGCKISVSDPVMDQCLPMPSRNSNDGSLADHEAGLGGWPLSLPSTFVAFPSSPFAVESAFAPANATSVSASALASAALRSAATAPFRKAAIEVDDEELTVILTPQKSHKCSGSSRTPSTASTMAPPSPQVSQQLPSVVAYSRLVFPLSALRSVKLWTKADVLCCWPNGVSDDTSMPSSSLRDASSLRTCDPGVAWTDVVEIAGLPRGGERELAVLLALPSTALAKRLQDALQRRPRRPHVPGTENASGFVGALRCELHIPVDMDLGPGHQTNFSAVVRRGICEACHVSADRVRVCSIRNTSFEKAAPSQTGYLEADPSAIDQSDLHGVHEKDLPKFILESCSVVASGDASAILRDTPEEESETSTSSKVAMPPETSHRQEESVNCSFHQAQDVPGESRHVDVDMAVQALSAAVDIAEQAMNAAKSPSGATPSVTIGTGDHVVSSDTTDIASNSLQDRLEVPLVEAQDEAGTSRVEASTRQMPLQRGISEPLIDLSDRWTSAPPAREEGR
mmetsp:Transcript_15568/g.24728  ORF Transcript_15568/g.24728 Transcript_15568/m.24728 type:complete len:683 (+) Transcript_15568:112-2160(+)